MLRAGVQQVLVGVIVGDQRIDIGDEDHNGQQAQHHDVDLFLEEHPEHALPVGIAGGSDLLGAVHVVVHVGEQLLLGKAQVVQIHLFIFHFNHLAFEEKEILGSTRLITTSPRMMEITLRVA